MGLFKWLGDKVSQDAEHKTQIWVKPAQVEVPNRAEVEIKAEQHYVRIWLTEMFLREGSKWFSDRYPLVYSLISLNYGDSEAKEFANVSGKNRLEIKQTDLGRSFLQNYQLTPLLPFRGGTIAMDCGLVSMESSNIVRQFAGVVSEFAGKVGGAQVSQVADLAGSIATSVQSLLGAGDAETMLYFHNAFSATSGGTPLKSGYVFLSEEREGTIEPGSLWVTRNGIRQGDQRKELSPQDYMLLQIECVAERDDYLQFSYVRDPFNEAMSAKFEGEDDKAKLLLGQAKRAVQRSPDFTAVDRKRIRIGLDKLFKDEVLPVEEMVVAETLNIGDSDKPDWLGLAIRGVTIEEARNLPDPGDD